MWERGLKYYIVINSESAVIVAPYAGAWIEIGVTSQEPAVDPVALYAGAWIEMSNSRASIP
ncbi:hypothetical protein D3C84_1304790 [compost metagenome]